MLYLLSTPLSLVIFVHGYIQPYKVRFPKRNRCWRNITWWTMVYGEYNMQLQYIYIYRCIVYTRLIYIYRYSIYIYIYTQYIDIYYSILYNYILTLSHNHWAWLTIYPRVVPKKRWVVPSSRRCARSGAAGSSRCWGNWRRPRSHPDFWWISRGFHGIPPAKKLVGNVWNMNFMTFHILGMLSSQLIFVYFCIFQRGRYTTNQKMCDFWCVWDLIWCDL